MKKNLRGKIREYVQSEDGKVGIKSPLTLGVAAGGLLLAHAIVGTPDVAADAGDCRLPANIGFDECAEDHTCTGPFYWNGTDIIGSCIPD